MHSIIHPRVENRTVPQLGLNLGLHYRRHSVTRLKYFVLVPIPLTLIYLCLPPARDLSHLGRLFFTPVHSLGPSRYLHTSLEFLVSGSSSSFAPISAHAVQDNRAH